VIDERERVDRHRDPDIGLPEDLLQRVEREARQLALDEVRAVLHHDAQLAVAARTGEQQRRGAAGAAQRGAGRAQRAGAAGAAGGQCGQCRRRGQYRSADCHIGTRCSLCTHSWPTPSSMHFSHASSMQRVWNRGREFTGSCILIKRV
jgi:hypothetical protein